ncbi:DUF485 domain-containing protein [Actinomadura macra]|uniref:DUF485 domain-containing protein n=1 Tax=Actinomadura macra TaxID=46164 RepID=UPI003F75E6AB
MRQSPEFERLRLAFRRFVFPMTAAFLVWYLLYVVLSAYARGFMGHKLVGEINVALVFGLLQFVSTFLIAWTYERYARGKLEPLAENVRGAAASAGGGATAAGSVLQKEKPEATPKGEAAEPQASKETGESKASKEDGE